MDDLWHWRLCDEYTVKQAALLATGEEPSQHNIEYYDNGGQGSERYEAVVDALKKAVFYLRINANISKVSCQAP